MALFRGRKPLVIAMAIALIGIVLAVLAPAPKPVFAIRGDLALQPSNAVGNGNAYRADTSNMVLFAAAIERAYNGRPADARVASSEATLYGMGVLDGSRVELPDFGGQWGSNFNRPFLRIDVVAPSGEEAALRFAAIVARIRGIAQQLQTDAGVPPTNQVSLELMPADPAPLYVSGSALKFRVAGVLLAMLAAAGIYSILTRRQNAAQPPVLVPQTT